MRGRTGVGAAALVCAVALGGCTADAGTQPTPSPTPSAATPTESAAERQERLDYAAAEKAYRTFRAEYGRVLRAGGAKEPTKLMRETAGGDYLKEFQEIVAAYEGIGARDEGRERIAYVRRTGYSRTTLVLDVCEDGREITTLAEGRRIKGEVRSATLELRLVDGRWKVWSGTGREVSRCD
nr:hypothetical protein [uncultured Friedmanniella sp.]